jgi:hypothetical protein
MPIDSTDHKPTLLDSLLEPFGECLTLEVAEKLVKLRANPVIVAKVEELAEKCNEGQLTTDERDEYESYVHVNNVMMMLKARARKFLQANRSGSAKCTQATVVGPVTAPTVGVSTVALPKNIRTFQTISNISGQNSMAEAILFRILLSLVKLVI